MRAMLARAWSLLLVILLSSLVMATTVHARELSGPATVECPGTVHDDGDTGDTDGKAALHHHGNCHAGTFSVPRSGAIALPPSIAMARPAHGADAGLASRDIDPALRPPSA